MTDPTPSEAFEKVLATKRAEHAQKHPKPAPAQQVTKGEGPNLRLITEAAEAETERQARLAVIAERERQAAAEQEAARWRQRALLLTGFPRRAIDDLLTYGDAIKAHDRWQRLLKAVDLGGLIALKGPPGTTKTTTATLLARVYIESKRQRAAYWKTDDYVAEFRNDTQGFAAPITQAGWIKAATERDGLLVLDEFDKVAAFYGDNFMSKQAGFWLEAIIDARYAAKNRPTIVLCNFDDKGWRQYVPEPVRDRFKSNGVIFNCLGDSKRGRE